MSEVDVYGELFPVDDTLCNKCKYRLSRTLIPLDLERFNIDEEALKEISPDGNEIAIEQHTCLIIGEDMDYLVSYCNKFKLDNDNPLFKHDIC